MAKSYFPVHVSQLRWLAYQLLNGEQPTSRMFSGVRNYKCVLQFHDSGSSCVIFFAFNKWQQFLLANYSSYGCYKCFRMVPHQTGGWTWGWWAGPWNPQTRCPQDIGLSHIFVLHPLDAEHPEVAEFSVRLVVIDPVTIEQAMENGVSMVAVVSFKMDGW